MSIKLQTMVWDLDLPLSRKMLMLSLADQANDEGFCWPDYETLARRCSVSRRTLFQCLSDLEQDGLVTRLYEGKPGQEKVIFQINLDALLQQELALPAEPAGPVSPPSLAGAKSAPVRNLHRCENRTGAKKRTDPVRNLHSIKQPSNSNHQGGGARLPARASPPIGSLRQKIWRSPGPSVPTWTTPPKPTSSATTGTAPPAPRAARPTGPPPGATGSAVPMPRKPERSPAAPDPLPRSATGASPARPRWRARLATSTSSTGWAPTARASWPLPSVSA